MTKHNTANRIQQLVVVATLTLFASTAMAVTTVEVGDPYTDPGATAYDTFEGDLTNLIVASNNVNTAVLGTYSVTYEVSDTSGNTAGPVVRTVQVVDTTAPVITLVGSDAVTLDAGTRYDDAGVTASDNYDGDLSAQVQTAGAVNASVPGVYTLTYTVSDSSGNTAEATRQVEVLGQPVEVTVASPLHGSIFNVATAQAVVPVTVTAHASGAVEYVEYQMDGQPFGMAFEAPYAVTSTFDVASFGLGQHTLTATARVEATQEDVVTTSVFTVETIADQDDTDNDGIPDNPYAALPLDGDTWVKAVDVAETGGTRTVGAARFEANVSAALREVPVVMGLDGRVTVSVPRALLQDTESGVVIVAVSEDAESLLGAEEAALLGGQPAGYTLVEGGRYAQVSVITSADGGANYQDIDNARPAANPVHLDMQGLVSEAPRTGTRAGSDPRTLFAHDTFVEIDDVTGLFFAVLDGDWYDAAGTADIDMISADLTSLSALVAPYTVEANANPRIIGDVNSNGVIDDEDTTLIRYLISWGEQELNAYLADQGLNLVDAALADVDLDGSVNNWDRRLHGAVVKRGIEYVNDYLASHDQPLCHIGETLPQ